MDTELSIRLLGNCTVTLAGKPLDGLFTKHEALLAFLAVTGEAHARLWLASLLWGGKREADALRNLRVNLTKVRQLLGAYLLIDRQSLAFDRESHYWLDVEAFEDYLARGRLPNGRFDYVLLKEAVALYQGEFMAEFDLRDAPEFEDWLQNQRDRLQKMLIQALDVLVEHCVDSGIYTEGIAYAHQLLAIEPWREETHQQLMWLLALDGQHSAALAQYEVCQAILQQELEVEPTAETVGLYRDIQAMRQQAARQTRPLPPLSPLAPQTAVPFLVPPVSNYFLGRAVEIDQLWQQMAQAEGPRRFLISGMGGVGKTSLAIQAAHSLRPEFPDGVLWVNATDTDPLQIAEQWAAAYAYDFSQIANFDERMAAFRQMIAQKQALLIFDDVVEASRIRPLLPADGSCTVLITTRNAALASVLAALRLPLRELSGENGRLLLTQIVGAERIQAESDAAGQICDLLQNLPLAITIAGRYLAQRPRRRLAELVERLREQGERLAALALDDLAVRLSFMVSWQALDDTQKQIFRYLGVFAGRSFTTDALAAVADLSPFITADRIHSLVLLSLLNEEGDRHYRQHPLLADFAREQLGDDKTAQLRMARYFLTYAQSHAHNYPAFYTEWGNLFAGIETAYQLQQWQDVVDYTQALEMAWLSRGRYSDVRHVAQLAHQAALLLEDDVSLAHILRLWGVACLEQRDYAESEQKLLESLHIFRGVTDEAGMADVQYLLARLAKDQAELVRAASYLDDCLQIRRALGDSLGIAAVMQQQARIAYRSGQYDEALQLGYEALALQESANDTLGIVHTLCLLANITLERYEDQHATAEKLVRRALELSQVVQNRSELAVCLELLAEVYRDKGDYKTAEMYALDSLSHLIFMGDRLSEAQTLYRLSRIYEADGDEQKALDFAARSATLCFELDDQMGLVYVLRWKGILLSRLSTMEAARADWAQSLALAEQLGHQKIIAEVSAYLARS